MQRGGGGWEGLGFCHSVRPPMGNVSRFEKSRSICSYIVL